MCKCNQVVEIKFAAENETVIIPSKNRENAGLDIYANFEQDNMIINPHETKMIPTGLASALPETHYFQLMERGSTGTKGIAQRCGVIDSGYRNFWFVPITNTTDKPLLITKEINKDTLEILADDYIVYPYSKAICQAVLIEVPETNVEVISVDELKSIKSLRGIGNLGASGK